MESSGQRSKSVFRGCSFPLPPSVCPVSQTSGHGRDQKVQLVELVYALKVAGVFNHGQAKLKEVAQALGRLNGVQAGVFTASSRRSGSEK